MVSEMEPIVYENIWCVVETTVLSKTKNCSFSIVLMFSPGMRHLETLTLCVNRSTQSSGHGFESCDNHLPVEVDGKDAFLNHVEVQGVWKIRSS